ncbi:TrbC/VirB2 family protein [Jannaschia aquimarina]|uniref:TrbC/VIRB2 family protein n=1 Tax=Jannaschia aquimarina TaxID=935700 RepID=A0A0D1CP84_9RHOB|nr:TrbC/VirB2 family protein [Jannaschia aquimarina]KIT16577.1 TrbC/VIRB2 family protein [Jannaschia aquimarina]SNT41610.1 TrbC/VIRB2 family protein [Jannaschia aquimarina]
MTDNIHYVYAAIALFCVSASPAMAQAIDVSAFDAFLTSVLNALTGTTGRLIMTLVAAAVLMAGTFNFIDWSRVFQVLFVVVAIGVIPTIIQSIWGAAS